MLTAAFFPLELSLATNTGFFFFPNGNPKPPFQTTHKGGGTKTFQHAACTFPHGSSTEANGAEMMPPLIRFQHRQYSFSGLFKLSGFSAGDVGSACMAIAQEIWNIKAFQKKKQT